MPSRKEAAKGVHQKYERTEDLLLHVGQGNCGKQKLAADPPGVPLQHSWPTRSQAAVPRQQWAGASSLLQSIRIMHPDYNNHSQIDMSHRQ